MSTKRIERSCERRAIVALFSTMAARRSGRITVAGSSRGDRVVRDRDRHDPIAGQPRPERIEDPGDVRLVRGGRSLPHDVVDADEERRETRLEPIEGRQLVPDQVDRRVAVHSEVGHESEPGPAPGARRPAGPGTARPARRMSRWCTSRRGPRTGGSSARSRWRRAQDGAAPRHRDSRKTCTGGRPSGYPQRCELTAKACGGRARADRMRARLVPEAAYPRDQVSRPPRRPGRARAAAARRIGLDAGLAIIVAAWGNRPRFVMPRLPPSRPAVDPAPTSRRSAS